MSTSESGGPSGPQPSEEELREALEEQMRNIRVEDVLVQTAVTLVNLAGRRLGLGVAPENQAEERDIEQSRTAIEAVRALLPVLPEDTVAPLRDALSQLQMAFAREARAPGGGEAPGAAAAAGEGAGQAPQEAAKRRDEEAERAKARSKIWTPPGA